MEVFVSRLKFYRKYFLVQSLGGAVFSAQGYIFKKSKICILFRNAHSPFWVERKIMLQIDT